MRNLFAFIYRFRAFLIFVLLEVLSVFLIIRNNSFQNAAFYNSSNYYVGQVLGFKSEIADYFRLVSINNTLAQENADLRQRLLLQQQQAMADSNSAVLDSVYLRSDSLEATYRLRPARVINNSTRRLNNFITLNAGSADGIQRGMGVFNTQGVVGRVKNVSANFATVTSVLHSQMRVSAKLESSGTFGTIMWNGEDPQLAQLHYIPLHVNVSKGDTIVTSGYNPIFPEGIMIGTVSSAIKELDKSFFTIEVKLAVDFSQLSYVYVVESLKQPERDSLEQQTGILGTDE